MVSGLSEWRESDIMRSLPEKTRSGSEDIAGIDNRVTAQEERIGYSFC